MENLIEKKSAFEIRAKVNGKSWLTHYTVLTSETEENAKEKAVKLLGLTDEHEISISPVNVYSSSTKLTAEEYPYGRLKTTAFFSVESNKNGFRTVFQTIDPKSGRINNPKKSTYSVAILPMMHASNGHCGFCGYLDFNGDDAINKGLQFMSDFYDLFTQEEVKSIAVYAIAMMKVSIKSQVIYCGSNFDELNPLFTEQIKNLVKIANTGENLFLSSLLDVEKINSLKVPDFNPFTVKAVSTI